MNEALTRRSIDTIRTLAMDAVEAAKSGHPGTPMALAPLAYALWARVMAYDPSDPAWPDRDRFVLSAGHASMLQYAALHLTGYDLSLDDLKAFRQWGSKTPGHPELHEVPGVETTTGPLGQGLSTAVGLALAERMLAARFNRPGHEIVDHHTWVIASDGDLMEGVASEACSLAGHWGLGKLIVFYDDNKITIDGTTDVAFTEDVGKRFEAYGWQVLRVADTATVDDLVAAAEAGRREAARPTLVMVRTHIGIGSPNKQDTPKAHGEPLGKEEIRLTKRAYGWPEDAAFLVPDDVKAHLVEAGRHAARKAVAWRARLAAYRAAFPAEAPALEAALSAGGGPLPADLDAALAGVGADGKPVATRKASAAAIQALAARVPSLVGGSADLAGSNGTTIAGSPVVQRGAYGGRNLAFGVREHAMGAVCNGLALHGGFRPFGGTFLVFSDFLRPAIRLASLQRLGVVYVFTHDSIGLGEDGPTHQPVEHLAALRSIPGVTVIRPADAVETAAAWKVALEAGRPVALALTRQDLAPLPAERRAVFEGVARGGYVVAGTGTPAVVLVASGSEVGLALAAARLLEARGTAARVVSMPSLCRFGAQPAAYRESVLPRAVPTVVVEAATSFGWHRHVGPDAAFVTLEHFGASAPAARLFAEFGFTPENVARQAEAVLASHRR
ncbi:MAG: transketolase [Planctomycetia bacterium]|nr:transketolase [Planctomycetia bacterium]